MYISDLTNEQYERYFNLMSSRKQQKFWVILKKTIGSGRCGGTIVANNDFKLLQYIRKQIVFKTGEYGKPFAVGCIEFNISHSSNLVVCCISDKPIGVDVEMKKVVNSKIMKKLCPLQI